MPAILGLLLRLLHGFLGFNGEFVKTKCHDEILLPLPPFVVPPEGISFKDVITDFEKRLIESTLEAAGGVQKRAAELLHIKPTTLNEMIKRYEIRPRRKRLVNGNGHATEPGASGPEEAEVPEAGERVSE